MEFGALAQLVKDSLQKNLPLDTAKLVSTSINQISNDVFPGNLIRLDLSGAKDPYEEDAKNQRVIVRGKGVDLPFTGLDSEIQFYLVGNEAALTWTATGNALWTMGKAFPQLQKTICDELRFANTPPPQLILNSQNEPPAKHQGVYFAATIDLNALTAGLAGVLGIASLQISGPIVVKDHGSTLQDVNFVAPLIKSINLGIAHVSDLSFAVKSQYIFNPLRKTSFISPYILLSTEIPFKSQGEDRPIPVSVRLVDLESDVRFSADPTHLIDAGLDELESLTNGVNLKTLKLPDKFHIEDIIKFSDFFFDFNLQTKKVTQVCIGIESAHSWPILHLNASQQDLILEQIGLTFRILDPFGKKLPSITLSGELEFGKAGENPGILILTATYPDWSIQGYLKEGTELDLAETLPPFLGSTAPVEKLAIDVFDFELSKGNYAIALDIKGDWDIPIGSTGVGLGLEQLQFSISYQTGAGTDAFVEGRFRIATLDIDVSAKHPASATEGWTFTGSVIAESGISISELFAGTLDARFPSGTPSAVPPMLDLSIKSLGADFNTESRDFHFDTEIDLGPNLKTVLTFAKLRQDGATPPTFEKLATGVITVSPGKPDEVVFALGIDLKPDSKHFVALYANTAKKAVNLGDLVKAMFPSVGSVALPNFSITIKDGIVGYVSDKQGNNTVFALDMDASLDLSRLGDIPLIGKSLSAAKTLTLAFQLVYAPNPVATADLVELNKLITVAGPQFPADQPAHGVSVKTELRIGASAPIDFKLPVMINSSGQLQSNGQQFTPPPSSQPTDDGVKWFQLNQQFGPVHLQRAGFKFENGEVTALLDGGLTALGLEVDLMGLSVSSKITDVEHGQFKPEFGLQGLGLSFSKGGVGFAGALLRLKVNNVYEYDGLASVQAEGLRLAAIGTLSEINGQTSLFLYAVLDYALGGSPFFYVTGLAGGFGLNQKLIMPAVDQVFSFPLILAAKNPPTVPTDPGAAGTFITDEMKKLRTSLMPNIGQYFGCAGIHFTSFELLDSFLLVSISFGKEFELDLIGVSTLVVPPQLPESEPALAQVSLEIVGSFIPSEGIAIVQGRLTADSHILDPNCHLTGGFAFATWFGPNPHAGDFVVTLGGYHPDFQKPAHYPTVPRIGVNWKISTELSVTGGIYFALTPRALMAGGAMRAIFQTSLDLGIATVDVKAWFILGADFIVYWKPFHYSAHIYIDIGIDVVIHFLGTHELSLDAGADLQVWGPKFGGHAHVFVKVIGIRIGFDVKFGASAPTPPPLDWDNDDSSKSFRKSFLPDNDKIVSVAISDGLVRKIDVASKQAASNTADVRYVINAKDFRVRTNSVIPIKAFSTAIKTGNSNLSVNKDFGIAPMAKDAGKVDTFHQITVTRNNEPAHESFLLSPIYSNVPGGLWATENSPDVNAPGLIENALIGFEIVPAKPTISGLSLPIPRDKLSYSTQPVANAYSDDTIHTFKSSVPTPGNDPVANNNLWTRVQKEIHTNTTRDEILAGLGFGKADFDIGESFTTDALYAPSYGSLNFLSLLRS